MFNPTIAAWWIRRSTAAAVVVGSLKVRSRFENTRLLPNNTLPRSSALRKLATIGEAPRAMLRESLRQTPSRAVDRIVDRSRKQKEVLMQLGLG